MDNYPKSSLGLPQIAWIALAVGGGFILCALGVKSIFASDVSLQVLDAQLQISNTRLDLAQSALKTKDLIESTQSTAQLLEKANNAHAEANQDLLACHSQLEQTLPPLEKFPLVAPEIVEPIPDAKLEQTEKSLDHTQKELEAEIDQIFKN